MTILVSSGDDRLAKERLARLIKELRGIKTQREFAKLLGTSYTAVQDWEKQVRFPREDNLKRIAQLKGWTQEELLQYLFLLDDCSKSVSTNSFEILIAQVQKLSLQQMEQLSDYLNTQLSQVQNNQEKTASCFLNQKQKQNLHLLLRASLKNKSPTEAMAKAGVKPELFTDIFLRNDARRSVDYDDLEKFSSLCCRVIQWRENYPPEIDLNQTYLGATMLLLNDLNGGG